MNLLETARHLGSLRAVELSCFARLGGRAGELSPACCACWAASASRAHAWRAGLIEDLLPVSVGLPGAAELTVVAKGALGDALELCLPVPGRARQARGSCDSPPDNGLEVVAGVVGQLYPLLLADYGLRLDRCEAAGDGAVARSIRRAVADLEQVRTEGSALF